MKNKFLILVAIAVCVLLLADSYGVEDNESQGVPDAVVLDCERYHDFVYDYDDVEYEITHNVNPDTHVDDVTLTLSAQTGYATVKCITNYKYQYYKSDDMWTLVESSRSVYSTTLDTARFVSESPWKGTHNNTDSIAYFNNEFTYEVYIDEIDVAGGYITLRYNFNFTNDLWDDVVQNSQITLPLQEVLYGAAFRVEIDLSDLYTPFESGIYIDLDAEGFYGSFQRLY